MPRAISIYREAAELQASRTRFAVVTVVRTKGSTPRKAGAKMIVCEDGRTVGTIGGGRLEQELVAEARAAIAEHAGRLVTRHLTHELAMCCGGEVEAFIDPVGEREYLVLVGGGHVNAALAPIAASLDFEVVVVDALPEFANPTRFPDAARLVPHWDPEAWGIPLDARTFIVIATREHSVDQDVLERLARLQAAPAYVGVISSRGKIARFRRRLEARGIDHGWIEQVKGPIGLPIDAETPAEIAVAVAAELVAIRHKPSEPA